jgi:hypothetical protein
MLFGNLISTFRRRPRVGPATIALRVAQPDFWTFGPCRENPNVQKSFAKQQLFECKPPEFSRLNSRASRRSRADFWIVFPGAPRELQKSKTPRRQQSIQLADSDKSDRIALEVERNINRGNDLTQSISVAKNRTATEWRQNDRTQRPNRTLHRTHANAPQATSPI